MLHHLLQPLTNNSVINSFSISFHVTVLFIIAIFSLHKWCYSSSSSTTSNPSTSSKLSASNYYWLAFFTSLAFSLFSVAFCISNLLFCYYKCSYCSSSPSFQLDLAFQSLAWLALTAYLHSHSLTSNSSTSTVFPRLLIVIWVIFFLLSTCLIAIDFITAHTVQPQYWLLHSASLLCALFLSLASFLGRKTSSSGKSEEISEPLLNSSHVVVEESLFTRAGFLSLLTFSWIGPLLAAGRQKTIGLHDLPQLDARDCAHVCFPIFKSKLDPTASSHITSTITNYKLAKALVISNWGQIVVTAIYALIYNVSTYVGPYLIDYLVQYLNGDVRFANEGYILVCAFIVAKVLESLSQRHWFFQVRQVGVRVRSSLITLIYRKGLTLSSRGKQSRTGGEVINLISVDAERIGLFAWFMHDIWLVPVQITLALLILYSTLGLASIAALVATFFVMLANVPIGKMQQNYQEKLMECKDVRMKATSEILRNMRILKLQAWEMKFLSKILELRKNETNWLKKYVYTLAMVSFVFWSAPTFVAVVTFGACLLLGIPLDTGKILSALATFRVLQEPIYNLPDTIAMTVKTKISLDRISSFLSLEELQSDAIERLPSFSSNTDIEVNHGCFSWDISSQTPTLQDLNFQVLKGMRVAVCGTVGSGKSSLLSCMLGEVPKISGTVKICEKTAYVPQSAWIQSGKIQDNILFGNEMDIEKYDRILEACSLKKDLEILPFGDQTIIGERGINLSGGQKQRIQIARALYHDADVYLFDDPFSALDAHTGSYVFKECLLGLLASKTVIYVTHQVEFLPSADLILCMKDGRIVQSGKYSEMLDLGSEFMGLVDAHMDALAPLSAAEFATNTSYKDSNSSTDSTSGASHNAKKNEELNVDSEATEKGQLVQEEEREKGKVGFLVYWRYLTMAYKGALVPLILLTQILFQALQIGSNFWMTWAAPTSADVEPPVSTSVLIYVFIAFSAGSALCVLVRSLLVMTAGYKTAITMFNKMHACIFRAPMSFFDSTPTGRILNRASTDQEDVDTNIPFEMGHLAFTLIQLLGIIIVMSQVAWQVFVLFIPVMAITLWYQQYYLDTARELSRLVGVCKAPLIQHFAESLAGSTTIRSFNKDLEFSADNCRLMDNFTRPKFYFSGAREWLCVRLDMLSTLTFAFSLIFLISVPRGLIDPGIAGLAVTYGLNLNSVQAMVIWVLSSVENEIISVERILQYSSISSEPPLIIETNRPSREWPLKGEVDIRNLQVRYAPHMPFVLKGLTCTFTGGAKTGIVGRTGSGKSTLVQTLFRIIDPTVGQIVIDGIDITTIGLHDLRLRLSIIPQDPTMFEGTVRSNLDPLEEYTDEQIWEALDCCQLGDEVRRKEQKLDSPVVENGENWSVGQRQLVCLGRVLLKKSKVLVLDEATASVDTATDSLIQKTLRQQFSESTVITIAHRITSVLDSDMVVLLDNGLIVEQDMPSRLLENKASLFAQLVSEYTMRSSSSFDQLDGN